MRGSGSLPKVLAQAVGITSHWSCTLKVLCEGRSTHKLKNNTFIYLPLQLQNKACFPSQFSPSSFNLTIAVNNANTHFPPGVRLTKMLKVTLNGPSATTLSCCILQASLVSLKGYILLLPSHWGGTVRAACAGHVSCRLHLAGINGCSYK